MADGRSSEQVERIFYEHISFLYPSIVIGVIIFIAAVVAAFVAGIWYIFLAGVLGFLPAYFKNKRRNRFILTDRRFIREVFNPHHSIIAVPLNEIVGVKILSRKTDPHGTVEIQTTPAYGEQLRVDGETAVGLIICRKVPGHDNFREIVAFAANAAAGNS